MKQNSKSSLFLMELMISLLIFAVCACICAVINAKASINISESRDLSNALILAQNHAELIKSGKEISENTFYSDLLLATDNENDEKTIYSVVSKISSSENGVSEYSIEIFRTADKKLIYNINSALCP